jgi:hypothetical protein
MSALRVEFFFDEEASSWHFRVPATFRCYRRAAGSPNTRKARPP